MKVMVSKMGESYLINYFVDSAFSVFSVTFKSRRLGIFVSYSGSLNWGQECYIGVGGVKQLKKNSKQHWFPLIP